jgi:hypothetical protein
MGSSGPGKRRKTYQKNMLGLEEIGMLEVYYNISNNNSDHSYIYVGTQLRPTEVFQLCIFFRLCNWVPLGHFSEFITDKVHPFLKQSFARSLLDTTWGFFS